MYYQGIDIMRHLKEILLLILGILCLNGCGVTKPRYIDVEKVVTTYRDSTIYNVRDSIVYFPVEKIVDIVPVYDTLKLESSLAKATAYVDTNYHIIRGSLQNKPKIAKESHIEYKGKIVEKTDTVYVSKTLEVPVEVVKYKVPKWCWFLLAFNILTIGIFIAVKKPF